GPAAGGRRRRRRPAPRRPASAVRRRAGSRATRASVRRGARAGSSLDDLVRSHAERLGNRQSQRFGSLEVNDQLEVCRLLDREIGGPGALQDLVDKNGRTSVEHGKIDAVRDKGSGFRECAQIVNCGPPMLERDTYYV